MITWISNPAAYGAIGAYLEGRKASIGGISNTDKVRGYFLGECVYAGEEEDAAMRAVEASFAKLPANVINGLKD